MSKVQRSIQVRAFAALQLCNCAADLVQVHVRLFSEKATTVWRKDDQDRQVAETKRVRPLPPLRSAYLGSPTHALHDERNALNAAAKTGRWELAQHIYEKLQADGKVSADMQECRVLFNIVLGAFADAGNFDGAKKWFAKGEQDGLEANTKGIGKLIEAAAKASRIEEIEHLSSQTGTKSVEWWSMCMDAYSKIGRTKEVAELFSRMQAQEVVPNTITYNSLINAHSKGRQPMEAMEVLRSMQKAGVMPEVVTFGSVLDSLAQRGLVEESKGLLKEMASATVTPNVICMNAIINAHAEAARRKPGMLKGALAVLQDMAARALEPTQRTYASIIKTACNAHSRDVATDMLFNMEERYGIIADAIQYTAVMQSCLDGSQISDVKGIFQHMLHRAVQPHDNAYNTLIRACAVDKDPELATKYFQQMQQEHNLQPNVAAYTGVIRAYTRCRDTQVALTWLHHMLDAGIEVNAFPFRALTSACLHAKPAEVAVAETVVRLMSKHRVPLSKEMFTELKQHECFGERFVALQAELGLIEGESGEKMRLRSQSMGKLQNRRAGMLAAEAREGRIARADSNQREHSARMGTTARCGKRVQRANIDIS